MSSQFREHFHWHRLEEVTQSIRESTLQEIFNKLKVADTWALVGTPEWFLKRVGANEAKRFPVPYMFIPDVLWHGEESTVVALKRASKYEEIALVQVLQEAWNLRKHHEKCRASFPLPVIVASYSSWMRYALCYLFENGLGEDKIRFLEACFLEKAGDGRYLWLHEPLAKWVKASEPAGILSLRFPDRLQWYQVADSPTWVALRTGVEYCRPDTPYPYLFLAKVNDTNDYVVSGCCSEHHAEALFLIEPAGPEASETPPEISAVLDSLEKLE